MSPSERDCQFSAGATPGAHVHRDGIQIFIYPELRGLLGHLGVAVPGCPRPQGTRTASLRADVAAAAGLITLLALCWYPLETGLRGSSSGGASSKRGLATLPAWLIAWRGGGWGGMAAGWGGQDRTACHPHPCAHSPGSTRGPKRHLPV